MTKLMLVDDTPCSTSEFLDLFDLDHLSNENKKLLHKIFLETKDAFATHKWDVNTKNNIEMEIEPPSIEPKSTRYNTTSQNTRQQIEDILEQLIKYDIIRKCDEPTDYSNNIHIRNKINGNNIEILFDNKPINIEAIEIEEKFIKENTEPIIKGKDYVSIISLENTSYSVPLSKEAQLTTTFWANNQKYCFKRCPQGLNQIEEYLEEPLLDIASKINGHIIFLGEEFLIATKGNETEHFKELQKVLTELEIIGLKIRPQRMTIAKKDFTFAKIKMNIQKEENNTEIHSTLNNNKVRKIKPIEMKAKRRRKVNNFRTKPSRKNQNSRRQSIDNT